MNPLRIARSLRDDYLTLLRTTFSPRQQALRDDFNRQIEREPVPHAHIEVKNRERAIMQQEVPRMRIVMNRAEGVFRAGQFAYLIPDALPLLQHGRIILAHLAK